MSIALNILTRVAATTKRTEKESILRGLSAKEANLIKQLAIAAYDPYLNFYITAPSLDEIAANYDSKMPLTEAISSAIIMLGERHITGNQAALYVKDTLSKLALGDQEVYCRAINRDLRIGCSASTFNKVWPGLIPEFDLMACHTLDEKTEKKMNWNAAYAQLKYDAARVAVIVKDGIVSYRTRNGLVYQICNPTLDNFFLDAIARLDREPNTKPRDLVFDGELYQLTESGKPASRQISNGVATKLIRGTASLEQQNNIGITVWDAVPLDMFEQGRCNTQYRLRWKLVQQLFMEDSCALVRCAETHYVYSANDAKDLAAKYMRAGEEGIIVKDPDGIWEAKRSHACLKVKAVRECDLRIVGVVEGTGKYEFMMGALEMESEDGAVVVSVGTGFSDDQRIEFWKARDEMLNGIATVRYNELILPTDGTIYSLFLPRFVEVRPDKDVADGLAKIKAGT